MRHSDIVCGLHCEANLQVIPMVSNISKWNAWWPDMPDATPDCGTFAERPSRYLTPPAAPAAFLSARLFASFRPEPATPPTSPQPSTKPPKPLKHAHHAGNRLQPARP